MLQLCFVLFTGATLVQLGFWWGVFARLALKEPVSRATAGGRTAAEGAVPFSILICARNEAAQLRKNLPSVLEQHYPVFEVLVVDDASSDDTSSVLRTFEAQYPQLRALRMESKTAPGKKQALARGIAAAAHECLLFTDADCQPASPDWLSQMAGRMQDAESGIPPGHSAFDIVLGYAPYREAPGLLNRWARFETVQTAMQYFSFALAGRPYMGVGRNLAWRRELFGRVGGFAKHAQLPSGDDDLLVNAAAHAGNTTVCLSPGAFVYSEAEKSWRAWARQKRRHLGAGHFYRVEHQAALGLLAGSHAAHYFLLTVLLFSDFGTISAAIYALRMASAFPIYWKILSRFREKRLFIWFPLFDALLAIYYAVFVPRYLICSNYLISWK